MSRRISATRQASNGVRRADTHEESVRRGLALHEAQRYTAALAWFDRALAIAPGCPVAQYDRATALHMLGRDLEAEAVLRRLIAADPERLSRACCLSSPRSLQVDARYLLFHVLVYGRGFSAEAFAMADEHLKRRARGLRSAWSVREVRAEVEAMRREWRFGRSEREEGKTRGRRRRR